jgi:hypothetical protein
MSSLASGPNNLSWSKNAYLLLNGINLAHPMRQVLSWNCGAVYKPLFLHTRFSGLLDKSPVLVQITGRQDAVYAQFLKHADEEWGLLLFSNADFTAVLKHLRWLVEVDQPVGKSVLLNLSDPMTANALFGIYPTHTDNRLFGPLNEVYAPDVVAESWLQHIRQGSSVTPDRNTPYRLNDEQIAALDEAAFRLNVLELDKHMREFFPDYLPAASSRQRFDTLYDLARQAYDEGFRTQADIFHYANVCHFLANEPEGAHPAITDLVRYKSALTPSQRIQQANWLIVEQERAAAGAQP